MPVAQDRIGPYKLIRKLGEGAFGEVWLARDQSGSNPREAAVKIPLQSAVDLDALLQEATLWARATGHPNVLGFLAARVFDGQAILVSEYAPDGSLKDWLEWHGGRASSVEEAVKMTLGILAGLEHLHARSIIHRDIKPDNVLLFGTTPRLADFGISRVLKTTHQSSATAGTPPYMAPEAFNRVRNQQTDIWSVGVILYQMLSGRQPFNGEDITEIYGAIRNEEPEPLPADVPDWLRRVVAKALAKDPQQRYQTAAEMYTVMTSQMPTVVVDKPALPNTVAAPQPQKPAITPTVVVPQPPQYKPAAVQQSPQPASDQPVQQGRLRPSRPRPSRLRPSRPRPSRPRPAVMFGVLATVAIAALATYWFMKKPDSLSLGLLSISGDKQAKPVWGDSFAEDLNGVKLELMHVPGGEYQMGSPEDEPERSKDEGPQHRVSLPGFYIGKYEVTRAQWKAVMGSAASSSKSDDLPIESISWNDARSFCKKLSTMTGKTYRLPSEAEWEYACRAGTNGAYYGNLNEVAWYSKNSGGKAQQVGLKQPNAFKLFDMHGNVWEWCEDVYHDSFGGRNGNPPGDGSAWITGGDQGNRILRGGSWNHAPRYARSANRGRGLPTARGGPYGMRVAVSVKTQ